MLRPRAFFPLLSTLAFVTFPVLSQSVVSTRSGMLYFFVGSVFLGDDRLEQKFGRFPDIGEGRELRTTLGRAEVLLTPGSLPSPRREQLHPPALERFSDTQVELLGGSAILEVTETVPDTAVKLIYKNWHMRVPQKGVYRIDTEPPQIRAYGARSKLPPMAKRKRRQYGRRRGSPLAAVLVAEPSTTFGNDDFKNWAMSRSQAISADNTIAAGIVDDPGQMDSSGLALGGYSYFPLTGIPSLDVGNPYGLSFWSPFQSTLSSIYFPSYQYGSLYLGWPSGRWRESRPTVTSHHRSERIRIRGIGSTENSRAQSSIPLFLPLLILLLLLRHIGVHTGAHH